MKQAILYKQLVKSHFRNRRNERINMKEYALYDVKDYEQCICSGNLKEIAKYLNSTPNSLRSYMTRKKMKHTGLLKKRYELIEIKEDEEEMPRKSDKEIFKEIIKVFNVNVHEVIIQFPKYEHKKYDFDKEYMQEEDFEGEEWKKIGNLNYEVSNYGRIKNLTTKKLKKLKHNRFGLQVLLWQNSKSYTITLSRLVAEMFIRHLEKNERAIHINGNSKDNYYKNLKIVSK